MEMQKSVSKIFLYYSLIGLGSFEKNDLAFDYESQRFALRGKPGIKFSIAAKLLASFKLTG